MDLALVGLGGTFAAVSLLAFVVQDYATSRHRVYRNLRTLRAFELDPSDVQRRELATPLTARVLLPGVKRLGRRLRDKTPVGVLERLEQQLVHAGSPEGWDAERVLAVKLLLAAALPILLTTITVLGGLDLLRILLSAGTAVALGWFGPEWLIRARASRRADQVRRDLPDSLDLLSITVEAGLAFDAALARVAREIGGPLGQELTRTVQEMQLGASRSEALRGLSSRTTVADLKEFTLAMIQADIFGISVSKVLHVQAREMRIKRRQAAEERAQKVPVKMIFPLILFILPATFIVLTGPAIMRIADFFLNEF